jgi:hypothetical protein
MKVYSKLLVIIIILSGLLSCRSNDVSPTGTGLLGTWLYIECGYSPGAGYIIDKIHPFPPQTISFDATGEVTAAGKDLGNLTQAHYYRIDSTIYGIHLVLLKNREDPTGDTLGMTIRGDTLKLSPPCYEGCHYGFLRIR